MADPDLAKAIKLTQDLLGKHVKKPPLSEKNLSRPPFRFLHDIIVSVINGTGFMKGVFSQEELDSNNISNKDAKMEFMKKVINSVNEATGEEIPVKVSKILAGQEPDKTNLLLQALAKAIDKSGGRGSKTNVATTKSKPSETKGAARAPEKKQPQQKTTTASKAEAKTVPPGKKAPTNPSTAASKNPKLNEAKTKKQEIVADAVVKSNSEKPSSNSEKASIDEQKEKLDANLEVNSQRAVSSTGKTLIKRQNSSLAKSDKILDDISEGKVNDGNSTTPEADAFGDSSSMQYVTNPIASTSQFIPEVSPFGLNPIDTLDKVDGHEDIASLAFSSAEPKQKSDSDSTPGPIDFENNTNARTGFDSNSNKASTRPGTNNNSNNNRIGTARPPSARPAPPRPKSSMFKDNDEPAYRPTTGKVTNVMLDNSDADEDDNFVVREVTVAQTQGLGDLDETPELALATGLTFDGTSQLEDIPIDQRGLLVDQILETQRELESKDKSRKEDDAGTMKSRETSKAEIEKLKYLLQECARNANPLGKLLDYVREDIDAMQKEVAKWRDESHALDAELESAKRKTEASLQPLQQQLTEVETRIADKEDAIAATKMSILRHQERIEKILSGLDRVKSGKITVPTASQLMKGESVLNSNKMRLEENVNDFQDIDVDNSRTFSSGFSNSLNRIARATPGMRPTSLFAANSDDLDPDNFDPFK